MDITDKELWDHLYQDEDTVDSYLEAKPTLLTLHPGKSIVKLRPGAPTLARRAGFAKGTFTAETYQPRLTGPIMFVIKLLQTWRLKRTDAIPLLGLEKSDSSYAEDLLSGRAPLRGRDIKDRIAYLFRIRKTLFALFRDKEIENEWLREPHDTLNGQTPMALLLEGSMDNILLVKEYVEAAAGR